MFEREASDYSKICANIPSCSPFSSDPALRNIVNGILAKYEVNMHGYQSVGKYFIQGEI